MNLSDNQKNKIENLSQMKQTLMRQQALLVEIAEQEKDEIEFIDQIEEILAKREQYFEQSIRKFREIEEKLHNARIRIHVAGEEGKIPEDSNVERDIRRLENEIA